MTDGKDSLEKIQQSLEEGVQEEIGQVRERVDVMLKAMRREGSQYSPPRYLPEEKDNFSDPFGELRDALETNRYKWFAMGKQRRKRITDTILELITTNHSNKKWAVNALPVENNDDSINLFNAAFKDPEIMLGGFYRLKQKSHGLDTEHRKKIISNLIDSLNEEHRPEIINDAFEALHELTTQDVAETMPDYTEKLNQLRNHNEHVSQDLVDRIYYLLPEKKQQSWREKTLKDLASDNVQTASQAISSIKWEDLVHIATFFEPAYKHYGAEGLSWRIIDRIPFMGDARRFTLIEKFIEISPKEADFRALKRIRETFDELLSAEIAAGHYNEINAKLLTIKDATNPYHWDKMHKQLTDSRIIGKVEPRPY